MKVIGKMMSLMGKEESITHSQLLSMKSSTIRTSLNWATDGHIMRDSSKMTPSMGRVISSSPMGKCLKEFLITI